MRDIYNLWALYLLLSRTMRSIRWVVHQPEVPHLQHATHMDCSFRDLSLRFQLVDVNRQHEHVSSFASSCSRILRCQRTGGRRYRSMT